jgi:hypothetical protein
MFPLRRAINLIISRGTTQIASLRCPSDSNKPYAFTQQLREGSTKEKFSLSSFRLRSYKPLGPRPVARTDRHFSGEQVPSALFVIAFTYIRLRIFYTISEEKSIGITKKLCAGTAHAACLSLAGGHIMYRICRNIHADNRKQEKGANRIKREAQASLFCTLITS